MRPSGDGSATASIPSVVAPVPGGAGLEFAVECRLSPDALHGEPHDIRIHPDWSVETPHDLDAERVAIAFGGYTSCLELVEQTIPAFRLVLDMLTRRSRLPVRIDKRGGWRVVPAQQLPHCCRGVQFRSIAAAGHHLHSPNHLSRQFGVPEWQLAALMAAAARQWSEANNATPGADDLRGMVREIGGETELWRAGVTPAEVRRLARVADSVKEPLPVSYYLGMVYRDRDPDWVSAVLAHRPDGDTAAWLAWLDSPSAGDKPESWSAWLDLGVSRDDVQFAVESGRDARAAHDLSRQTGRPLSGAARDLVRWARAGCHPTPDHFRALSRYGVGEDAPTSGAVDQVISDAGKLALRGSVDRTEVAVMLRVLGTRQSVLRALAAGVRSVADYERRSR